MLTWLASVAIFILGFVYSDKLPEYFWVLGLALFFLFPIPFELLLNLKALCFKNSLDNHNCSHDFHGFLPIVYSPQYNITACGLEKCHPFDSCKYGRIFT
jgi:histone deacetylase 11